MRSINVEANIPVNPRNGRRQGPYRVKLYRRIRSTVERFYGWLKSSMRITIRYGVWR